MKREDKKRRCIIQFVITYIVLLVAISVYVYIIDPFLHYHAPYQGISSYIYEQVYQTPGMIDYLEYDSAIIGTSMTENFRVSWFDDKQCHTVKLSYAAARTKDIRTMYDRVFANHKDLRFIWTDLEAYQLIEDPNRRGREFPEYMYNDYLIDDVGYVWNSDVFWSATQRVIESIKGINHNIDDAYTWEDPELFSAKKLINQYNYDFDIYKAEAFEKSKLLTDIEEKKAICKKNIDNIVPVIKEHPDTEFVYFFPPYSALYWYRLKLMNEGWMLDVYQYAAQELMKYPNVKVYYFQNEYDWITNLDMYRDECHHNPQINHMMFEKIWNDENRVTSENIDLLFAHMRDWLYSYDFEDMWRRIEEE